MGNADRHELPVLIGVHALLEVGESKGIALWAVIAVEGAMAVECSMIGIEHNVLPHAAVAVVPCPSMQTMATLGTVTRQAGLVPIGNGCFFVVHRVVEK